MDNSQIIRILSSDGHLLWKYEKTQERCLVAVESSWVALRYVPKDLVTEEMCLIAVSQEEMALKHVPDSFFNEEFVMKIIPLTQLPLKYVKKSKQTLLMVEAAVKKNPLNIKYVAKKYLNDELIKIAVSMNGTTIRFIPEKMLSLELCELALSNDIISYVYIPDRLINYDMSLKAVSKDGNFINYVPNEHKTKELCLLSVNNGAPLTSIPLDNIDSKLCLTAVGTCAEEIFNVPSEVLNEEIIKCAIEHSWKAFYFLNNELYTEQLVNSFFNMILTQNNEQILTVEEKTFIREISLNIPEELIKDEKIIEIIDALKLTTEKYYYSKETKKFTVVKEFNNVELKRKTFKKLKKLIKYCNGPIETIEGIEDYHRKKSLKKYALQYYRVDNKIEKEQSNYQLNTSVNHIASRVLDTKTEEWNFVINRFQDDNWKTYKYIDRASFSKERTERFFKLLHQQVANKKLSKEEERLVEEISESIPECFIKEKRIKDLIIKSGIADERAIYLDDLNRYVVIKEFRGIELERINFRKYELEKYNLRYSRVKNKIVKKRFVYDDDFSTSIETAVANTNIENLTVLKDEEIIIEDVSSHEIVTFGNDDPDSKIFYISDLHLIHKIRKNFGNDYPSYEDIYDYIEKIVEQMHESIKQSSHRTGCPLVFIGGDVSSKFEITKLFYEILSSYFNPKRIIAILGNHELWGFDCSIDKIIQVYQNMFNKLGITFLHNEVLFVTKTISVDINNKKTYKKLSSEEIEKLNNSHSSNINRRFNKTSYIVLGGLGFSGLDDKFNAENGIYRNAIKSREQDKIETKKFTDLYNNVEKHFGNKQVIVFTHTPSYDWTDSPLRKGWIYVSGHTHQNRWEENEDVRVYADNQVGYTSTNYYFKHFNLKTIDYDIFDYYKDGHYIITNENYHEFCRGHSLRGNVNREGRIHMLKRSGVYCFFFESDSNKKMYLLSGGQIKNINHKDLDYYYDNMVKYAELVKKASKSWQKSLVDISQFIKRIGGTGEIHGTIVDIDYNNHVYLNLEDGSITPYYALSVVDKYVYDDVPQLLQEQLPELYKNYLSIAGNVKESEMINSNSYCTGVPYLSTDIYKMSNIMLRIQALIEKNIIRIWNEDIFDVLLNSKRLES